MVLAYGAKGSEAIFTMQLTHYLDFYGSKVNDIDTSTIHFYPIQVAKQTINEYGTSTRAGISGTLIEYGKSCLSLLGTLMASMSCHCKSLLMCYAHSFMPFC